MLATKFHAIAEAPVLTKLARGIFRSKNTLAWHQCLRLMLDLGFYFYSPSTASCTSQISSSAECVISPLMFLFIGSGSDINNICYVLYRFLLSCLVNGSNSSVGRKAAEGSSDLVLSSIGIGFSIPCESRSETMFSCCHWRDNTGL